MQLERFSALAAVVATHLGFLWWVTSAPVQPPPTLATSSIQGVLIAAEAPVPPQPRPLPAPPDPPPAPEPPKPKPELPKPVPKPKPKPPSERAITVPEPAATPAAEANAPSEPQTAPPRVAAPPDRPGPPSPPAPLVPPRADAAHLNNPAPDYPSVSRRIGEEGEVLLDVHILPDGSVGEIRLRESSGFPRLDQAALEVVRRWRYVPARRGDTPIAYWYVQPIVFSLRH